MADRERGGANRVLVVVTPPNPLTPTFRDRTLSPSHPDAMLKRLLIGLLIGLVIGAAAAAALVRGLGVDAMGPLWAYLAASVTGVVTGLVAGKPIWSSDGKIEAGLKAAFGALLGAGVMFSLRRWAALELDLTMLGAGHGVVGELPFVALPIVGSLLGGFYEADNTPSPDGDGKKASAKAAGGATGKQRVLVGEDAAAADEDEAAPARAKKRR